MIPSTLQSVAIAIVLILPGACFLWGFERQAGQWGATTGERVFYFLAAAAGFHLVFAWAEYFIWRTHFSTGQELTPGRFAIIWGAVVLGLLLPALAGRVVGWIWMRWRIPRNTYRGWDYALVAGNYARAGGDVFVRVRTSSGAWLGGYFGDDSFAGEFPHEADLYLEVAYEMGSKGEFGEARTHGIYVPAKMIEWLEIERR